MSSLSDRVGLTLEVGALRGLTLCEASTSFLEGALRAFSRTYYPRPLGSCGVWINQGADIQDFSLY
jgi:hypothetical protein